MKKIILLFSVLTLGSACRKTAEVTELTEVIEVEEKNMSVITKMTSTGCKPCGGYGINKFKSLKEDYKGKATFLALRSGVGMADVGPLKLSLKNEFDLKTSTPTFSTNFIQGNYDAVNEHFLAKVVANSNYKMSVNGNLLSLETTTEFFSDSQGDFYLIPYVVVDGILSYQSGHPDSPNAELNTNVAGVAVPGTSFTKEYLGYLVAHGNVKRGYKVNLDFNFQVDPSWDKEKISIVLVILNKHKDSYQFVNSYAK